MYVIGKGNIYFICLADADLTIETAFSFLDIIKEEFCKKYNESQINSSVSGIRFADELKKVMEDMNTNPESAKTKQIISDLTSVKDVTADNLSAFEVYSR